MFRKINGGLKRFILLFYNDAFPQENLQYPNDQEMLALKPYCRGVGIDVGCGSRKTHPQAIGIDLTPKGVAGEHGSEKRQKSQADIVLSGDNLYLFADKVFDYVVARHNLEHYQDPVKALKEWKRVLKTGGILGIILPDDEKYDTIKVDPTHKHAFTQQSLRNLLETIGGFKIVKIKPIPSHLSFLAVAKKTRA